MFTASSCPVRSFGLEISPLKKSSAPLSAPQRPIATHRTTATPKVDLGLVLKNLVWATGMMKQLIDAAGQRVET